MKVKCIKKNNSVNDLLTLNKEYEVLEEGSKYYSLTSDMGIILDFKKETFEIVEEKEDNNMKAYSTWEVFKMIENDKTLRFTNDYIIIRFNSIFNTYSFYDAKNKDEKVGLWSINADEEWKLMISEVKFEEVLNSSKKCKVEHEFLDENMDFKNFDDLICFLSYNLNGEELKEIIKNGKWYLED